MVPPHDRNRHTNDDYLDSPGVVGASPGVNCGASYPPEPGDVNQHGTKPPSIKNNIIFCPYPKRKVKQHPPFPTIELSLPPPGKENDWTEAGIRKQIAAAGKECDVQLQEKKQSPRGNPTAAGSLKQTEENIANLLYVSSGGSAENGALSSSSSCEDQSDYETKHFPGANSKVASPNPIPRNVALQDRSMSRIGLRPEIQSSNISIYDKNEYDAFFSSDLDKKVSIIDLQTPTMGCLSRVRCRRVDRPIPPRATKSEQTMQDDSSDDQGAESSDHHLSMYDGNNELLKEPLKQQAMLLADWAKKHGAKQQQQLQQRRRQEKKDNNKKSPAKKDVGLALGTSDGDASPAEKGKITPEIEFLRFLFT